MKLSGLCIDIFLSMSSKFSYMVILSTDINEEIAYQWIQLNNTPTILSLFLHSLMNATVLQVHHLECPVAFCSYFFLHKLQPFQGKYFQPLWSSRCCSWAWTYTTFCCITGGPTSPSYSDLHLSFLSFPSSQEPQILSVFRNKKSLP